MEFAVNYLKKQHSAIDKWVSLDLRSHPKLGDLPAAENLIPFSGTKFFKNISEEQKRNLYFGFVQMICECFIVFEQMLLKSVRRINNLEARTPRTPALKAFAREEFYHLRAYRKYLGEDHNSFWPEALISRRTPLIKNIFAWLLNQEPLCIYIPGAKSEIFSVQYTKLLLRTSEIRHSDWAELNRLHAQDEVHHYGFDFDLMDSALQDCTAFRKLKIIFFTYLMSLAIQFIVIISGLRLVKRVFREEPFFKRLSLMRSFFFWSVLHFEPYKHTKTQLKEVFEKRSFPLAFFFKYLTW